MRILLLALLITSPALAERTPSSHWLKQPQCAKMCETIQACAEKMSRADLGRLLCHVAACEIGKLCAQKEVRSPTGQFHGPFQFVRGTWKSVCQPVFKAKNITTCSGPKAIYDSCCTTMCAAEIVAENLNGGIKNWPVCGKAGLRAIAAEKN